MKTQKWPQGDDILVGFRRRKDELLYEDGLLLWGNRIIIPKTMRRSMLDLLHEGHFNGSKIKSCARSLMFWPGMDKEIEALCAACIPCCANRQNPPKVELTPWPVE